MVSLLVVCLLLVRGLLVNNKLQLFQQQLGIQPDYAFATLEHVAAIVEHLLEFYLAYSSHH